MRHFARRDEGQTLVIVAAAIAVLLGALALGLDWGYGFTQRRVSQNAADAASLSAARALATSAVLVNGGVSYGLSQESLYCVAKTYADQNRTSFVPSTRTTDLLVQISSDATTWTTIADPGCPWSGSGTVVPASSAYVRVAAGTTYPSLVAGVVGDPSITARASARARIMGTGVGQFGVWPFVRHYDPADFNAQCVDPSCSNPAPFTFWSSQGSASNKNMVFGSFKGLVDFSRYSPRTLSQSTPRTVPQLVTAYDARWTRPAALQADQSGNCKAGWDTAGDEDPQNQDKSCSIPNWTYYTFGGTLALDSTWSGGSGTETPSDIGARPGVCGSASALQLLAPSCAPGSSAQGDWIETASNGNLGSNISSEMLAFIAQHGFTTSRSNTPVPGSNGKTLYGRAVTMSVFLWDCAESFKASAPTGSQWDLIVPKGKGAGTDCSQITDSGGISVDRVHLFTVAPFTFYEGLISTQMVQGFWGGAFADPKWCQANPDKCGAPSGFSNTAFLVPDE